MMRRSLAEPRPGRGARRARLTVGTLGLALAVAAAFSVVALGQSAPSPGAARPGGANDPVFARVDGRPIHRSEIESRKERGIAGYKEETGREVPPAFENFFRRTALEEAVRERLLAKDGRARGIRVSDAAAESVLRQDASFRKDGRFDAAAFQAYRDANPKGFAQVREEARDFLAFQRRARALEQELEPEAGLLDRLVARRTEKVGVRWLLLGETHFDGRHDPSDAEVRAAYARDRQDFVPPGRVSYTALTVPALEEGRISAPALARARRSADSLLVALRTGAGFDSLALAPGVVRSTGTWGQGQAQGIFASAPAWAESAFASPAGRVLPRPFETLEGMAVVRIDRATPRVAPPLADVAHDVRARLRAAAIEARDAAAARQLFEAEPDSFRVATWLVRTATIDAARVEVKAPREAELRAWFTQRPAEFARLDPAGGGLRTPTFEEVREEASRRYLAEQRALEARRLADRVAVEWGRGRGGPRAGAALEIIGPVALIEGSPLPEGMRADLADSARSWESAPRAVVVTDPRGYAVVGLVRRSDGDRPSFAVVEPAVRAVLARRQAVAERAAARAWFEGRRDRYQTGPGYAGVFALGAPPTRNIVDVPGSAIERYYRMNPGEFTPPEEVNVRHILIGTRSRSLAEARTLARELRGKLARGEDFAALARRHSEDPGSRDQGGDLGWITRGMTVPEFEQAAFALDASSPYSVPVETQYGVHLLQFLERRGGKTEPFEAVRTRITRLLVEQYADTLARRSCEQLLAEAKNRDQLVRRAEELRMPTSAVRWYEGFPLSGPAMLDDFRADAARTERGELFPGIYRYLDQGYVVAALDSLMPSRHLEFEEAEDRIVADYQRELRLAATRARLEQVERDLAAGRPWGEVTETLGGSAESHRVGYGDPLPGFGAMAAIDSVLFGEGAPGPGEFRNLETPRGTLLLSVTERIPAEPDVQRREREAVRRVVLNRRIYDYVEGLRAGAKIDVLRPELADRLPAPPGL